MERFELGKWQIETGAYRQRDIVESSQSILPSTIQASNTATFYLNDCCFVAQIRLKQFYLGQVRIV